MARFRLRYQSTDLEMQVGDFVVGRSSSCHLALDDALVSRRHAVFHVGPERVEVEDLGSRNGVQLNGETISRRTELKHLDRVVIGAQELLLIRTQQEDAGPNYKADRPTLAGMTLDLPALNASELPDEPTVHRTGSVIDRIAEKAMALGRFEEAERMLSRRLELILAEVRGGARLDEDKLLAATSYALKLAEGTGRAKWVDYVFSLHDAGGRVVDAESIGTLHELFRRLRYPGGPAFRGYLANMRARAESLPPAKRFLLKRLEGLERVIGG